MLGLALGSYSVTKWFSKRPFRRYLSLQFAISAFSMLIPLALVNLGSNLIALWVVQLLIAGMTLILSSLIGAEYSLASLLSMKKGSGIAARNYSADLFGSALELLQFPVFLFPLAGMMNTGLILAMLDT